MEITSSYIDTFGGRRIDLFNLRSEDININDIAMALSRLCRFGGHCREFYSVAQHSVLCVMLLQDRPVWEDLMAWAVGNDADTYQGIGLEYHGIGLSKLSMKALLHDAAEAYTQDLIRPVKQHCPDYMKIQDDLQLYIDNFFDIPNPPSYTPSPSIKLLDNAAIAIEKRDLLGDVKWDIKLPSAFGPHIRCLSPEKAYNLFLYYYYQLQLQGA